MDRAPTRHCNLAYIYLVVLTLHYAQLALTVGLHDFPALRLFTGYYTCTPARTSFSGLFGSLLWFVDFRCYYRSALQHLPPHGTCAHLRTLPPLTLLLRFHPRPTAVVHTYLYTHHSTTTCWMVHTPYRATYPRASTHYAGIVPPRRPPPHRTTPPHTRPTPPTCIHRCCSHRGLDPCLHVDYLPHAAPPGRYPYTYHLTYRALTYHVQHRAVDDGRSRLPTLNDTPP